MKERRGKWVKRREGEGSERKEREEMKGGERKGKMKKSVMLRTV